MSVDKKKAKNSNGKNIIILSIVMVSLVFVFVVVLSVLVSFKKYYKIESRVSNVALANDNQKDSRYRTSGWLKVQGTNLDLPVLTGINDNTNFPVEMKKYVWSINGDGKFHNKIDIMGHNIFNLSSSPKLYSDDFYRFEELMGFVYYDFAKENKYIQLTIDGKDYLYKIFSVNFLDAVDVDSFPSGDYEKSDLKYQIDLFKKLSLYDYDIEVNENDNLISLITCTRFFGNDRYIDFLVNGRLVREGESVNNYSVVKNKKNYAKVENILKGDDDNESEDSM